MCISKRSCPVPYDQQPLNEYVSLKKSCFFAWSLSTINNYISTICSIFLTSFFLLIPLIYSLLSVQKNIINLLSLDIYITTLIFICIFFRLYLGWSYIIKRLVSATVFYEESGWYDGQIWVKNTESLMKDRLIGLYHIDPFIKRIQYSLVISVFLFLIESLLYYLL
nr:hypothetical protein [Gloiopeltis furcata]